MNQAFAVLLVALLPVAAAVAVEFDTDFSSPPSGDFVFRGAASYEAARDAVQLTPPAGSQVGMFFFRDEVSSAALTVDFTISIGGGSGADGMAFALVAGDGPPMPGGGGGSLGLTRIAGPLLILEIDTWANGIPDSYEANGSGGDNHIALKYVDGDGGEWDRSADVHWTAPFPLDDGAPLDLSLLVRAVATGDGPVLEALVHAASSRHDFVSSPILHLRLPGVSAFSGFPGWSAATGGSHNRHLLHAARLEESAPDIFPDSESHLRALLFDHYPDLAQLRRGDTVFVVDTGQVPGEEEILASTLAGLLGRTQPRVYMQGGAFDWRSAFQAYGAQLNYTYQSDAVALLRRFRNDKNVSGYILYENGNDSINVATSLTGVLNAVAVEESLEAAVSGLGLPRRLDVRARDEAWLMSNYAGRFFNGLVIQQEEGKRQLRDVAALWSALTFFGSSSLRDRAYGTAAPDSPVFGWGTGGEDQFVGAASDRSLFTIPSDWAWNVGLHSAVRSANPLRQRTRIAAPPDRGNRVHFVTFVMSDGDNLQWLLNDFQTSSRWFGSARRGTFPMGWSIAPHLVRLAPLALARFYATASRASGGEDYFVCGVSGGGYLYPSRYDHIQAHARRLDGYLGAADLDLVTVLEHTRGTFTPAHLDPFTRQPNVRGVLYLDYGRYAYYRGQIVWSNGKPAVSARYSLWDGQDSPDEIAAGIAGLSFNPSSENAYSYVNVHPWSRSLDDVKATIDRLPANAVVVTPDEFFAQLVRYRGTGPTARIHVPGVNYEAVVEATASQPVDFDARFSTDPNSDIAEYEWDVDCDGTVDSRDSQVSFSFASAGAYSAKLTVIDSGGRRDSETRVVQVKRGERAFIRGDANDDAQVDIADAIAILNFLFLGHQPPPCRKTADVNDDSGLDVADPLFELNFLFGGGPSIPAPYPACGADPTADAIPCDFSRACAE